jgi:hypothetical protein
MKNILAFIGAGVVLMATLGAFGFGHFVMMYKEFPIECKETRP